MRIRNVRQNGTVVGGVYVPAGGVADILAPPAWLPREIGRGHFEVFDASTCLETVSDVSASDGVPSQGEISTDAAPAPHEAAADGRAPAASPKRRRQR